MNGVSLVIQWQSIGKQYEIHDSYAFFIYRMTRVLILLTFSVGQVADYTMLSYIHFWKKRNILDHFWGEHLHIECL